MDLSDNQARQDLLQHISGETRDGVVITEGLLGYLTDENVEALARDLHSDDSLKWWITDVTDPVLASWMRG